MKRKIKYLEELAPIIANLKSTGKKIVHCHGVFDLLHIGHIKHFEEAKTFGEVLVVSITPDEFVNKGPGRPAFTTSLRLESIAAAQSVESIGNSSPVNKVKLLKTISHFLK